MNVDLLKNLIAKTGLSQKEIATQLSMSQQRFNHYATGKREPDNESLILLANFFGVSTDYLLGLSDTSTEKEKTPVLTKKDERDIARDLEAIMAELDRGGDMMFDGDPMSDEAKESIKAAMRLGLEAAKAKNKERFTPKKYRNEDQGSC